MKKLAEKIQTHILDRIIDGLLDRFIIFFIFECTRESQFGIILCILLGMYMLWEYTRDSNL